MIVRTRAADVMSRSAACAAGVFAIDALILIALHTQTFGGSSTKANISESNSLVGLSTSPHTSSYWFATKDIIEVGITTLDSC